MNTIELLLVTGEGDTVGRLPIANLLIGVSDDLAAQGSEVPVHQAACLYAQLTDAVQREGFEVSIDEIDFKIAVGRAILNPPADGPISISLPVRETNPTTGSAATASPSILDDLVDFDDLFAVDDAANDSVGRDTNVTGR